MKALSLIVVLKASNTGFPSDVHHFLNFWCYNFWCFSRNWTEMNVVEHRVGIWEVQVWKWVFFFFPLKASFQIWLLPQWKWFCSGSVALAYISKVLQHLPVSLFIILIFILQNLSSCPYQPHQHVGIFPFEKLTPVLSQLQLQLFNDRFYSQVELNHL